MDAKTFLGMESVGDDLHWRMPVEPHLTTPGNFLFGGAALAGALVALEEASGRPTVWATGQYLSYAPTHSLVEWEITLAVVGGRVTQGRAVGRVGDREILTVNAALGDTQLDLNGVWVQPPVVPPPEECPPRFLPEIFRDTIMDRVDTRVAKGAPLEELNGVPGDPDTALWARVPGHLTPSAATLAIFGDYVSGGASQPLGQRTIGRSLDNTLRVVQLKPTEWVLCDIRLHALVNGYAQGVAFLWSQEGELLATASQSFVVRLWPGDAEMRARANARLAQR
jgi:acyl-CoA thioesterase II